MEMNCVMESADAENNTSYSQKQSNNPMRGTLRELGGKRYRSRYVSEKPSYQDKSSKPEKLVKSNKLDKSLETPLYRNVSCLAGASE